MADLGGCGTPKYSKKSMAVVTVLVVASHMSTILPLIRYFSALCCLKIITLSTMSTHGRPGVPLNSVHFHEVLHLDAGKYDTLLEVVKWRKLISMVWTCGQSERNPDKYRLIG